MFFMWPSHLEKHMYDVPDVALPLLINQSELLEDKLRDVITLHRMLYAIWSARYRDTHIVHDFVLCDEAAILNGYCTHQDVANIFVKHNGKLVELSYVLGTLWGSCGPVLDSIIAPTEKWAHMEECLHSIFQRFTSAPEQFGVDDWQKWLENYMH